MQLLSDDYAFWASMSTFNWDGSKDVTLRIGNPKGRPKPCMTFTIDGTDALLQELTYYSTCSSPKQLERGAGTVQMVKSACVAVMHRFPRVTKVLLQDESYLPDPRRGNVPLPEYHMLAQGQTWYQKHFGAAPGDPRTAKIVRQYAAARLAPVAALGEDAESTEAGTVADHVRRMGSLTEAAADDLRGRLGLARLSGTVWEIPRATVLAYGVRGEFEEQQGQQEGGGDRGRPLLWKRSPRSVPYFVGRGHPMPMPR
jgi:hypothetical protein